MQRRLESSHQGIPIEGRRCVKIEKSKGLCPDERRAVPQNARRNFIKMHGARGAPEEEEVYSRTCGFCNKVSLY